MAHPIMSWWLIESDTYGATYEGRQLYVYKAGGPPGREWRWRVEETDWRGEGYADADAAKIAAVRAAGARPD